MTITTRVPMPGPRPALLGSLPITSARVLTSLDGATLIFHGPTSSDRGLWQCDLAALGRASLQPRFPAIGADYRLIRSPKGAPP